MSITSASGIPLNNKQVELAMAMINLKIIAIKFDYSGSGDSGSVDSINLECADKKDLDSIVPGDLKSVKDLAEEVFYEIVNPDFNNSGSYGSGVFILKEDGKLIFQCSHSDIIETTDDTKYDNTLIDTSDL
jgi:hypothetical protein